MPNKKNIALAHFTRTGKIKTSQKCQDFKCKYCPKTYTWHPTRFLQHLASDCPGISDEPRNFIKSKINSRKKKNKTSRNSRQRNNSVETSDSSDDSELSDSSSQMSSSSHHSSASASGPSKTTSIDSFADKMTPADQKFARFLLALAVYSSATPLSITENFLWKRFIGFLRPKFKIPSRYELSSPLLKIVHKTIKSETDSLIDNAKTVCIQCDGWSNIRQEGIYNFVVTTPQPVFYDTIATGHVTQDAQFVARNLMDRIDAIGINKVIGVCTDNASTMKASWNILKETYGDEISCYGCASHIFNLLMQDVAEITSIKNVIQAAKTIVKKIKFNHVLAAKLKIIQVKNDGKAAKTLKLPGKTRFGSTNICLNSVLLNKRNLQELAICNDKHVESAFAKKQNKKDEELTEKTAKELIFNDNFWLDLIKTVNLMKPITDWTIKLESNKSKISEVCLAFDELNEHFGEQIRNSTVSGISKEDGEHIMSSLEKRKEMAVTPLHFAANLIDPGFREANVHDNELVLGTAFLFKVEKKLGLDQDKLTEDLVNYKTKSDFFGEEYVQNSITTVSALEWWRAICDNTELSKVAIEILAIPPTSAATERSFSTYSWLHSAKRNRLLTDRAGMLPYITQNLRIFSEAQIMTILKNMLKVNQPDEVHKILEPIDLESVSENKRYEEDDEYISSTIESDQEDEMIESE